MSFLNPHLSNHSAITAREDNLSDAALDFTWRELAILGTAGLVAAVAIAFGQLPLRIPGHAILKAAIPMAMGMAFVARPLAGTIAGSASLLTAALLLCVGFGNLQAAAIVSLLLIGPAFDWARKKINLNPIQLVTRFALVGLFVNVAAFVVRWSTAFWQADGWHPLNFRTLGSATIVSFALCGIVTGVVCGMICRQKNHA